MEFYKILSGIMEEKKLTIPQVAKMTGLSDSTVRSIITRKQNTVALEVASKIATGLNVTYERLNGESEKQSLSSSEYDHIQKYRALDEHGIDVVDYVLDKEYERCTSIPDFFMAITRPYYITPASAGLGNPLDEPPKEELRIEDTPLHRLGDFIIGVRGDSMEPKFHDGDLVLVQKTPDIEIGEIGIFILNGESYIKQKGEDGLISLNPKYKPKVVGEFDEITCCGKVLCKIEKTY